HRDAEHAGLDFDLRLSPDETDGIQREAWDHAANSAARGPGKSAHHFARTRNCGIGHPGKRWRFQSHRIVARAGRGNAERVGEPRIRARRALAGPDHGSEKWDRPHEDRAEAQTGKVLAWRRSAAAFESVVGSRAKTRV